MSFFGQLPVELCLSILQHCDLSSLWHLTLASRDVAAVFDEYALETVEKVIANSIPEQTQALMRAVIRTRAACGPGLEAAQSITAIDSDPLRRDEVEDRSIPRRFLSLAHHLHTISHATAEYYIEQSLTVRPWSSLQLDLKADCLRQRFDRAKKCEYHPLKTGPPSWVEEQRIIKQLWRIQLFFELNNAQLHHRLEWPREDQYPLVDIAEFFTIRDFELQQLFTVYDFLHHTPEQRQTMSNYSIPAAASATVLQANIVCKGPVRSAARCDHYQQGLSHLDRPPLSYIFQRLMSRDGQGGPIPGLPFDPYRKYGFAIWDDQRMADLGFAEAHGRAILNRSHYFYRWYSILTEEDKALH
ncbi:hypothetical protein PFICI_09259 [Pestalotiopsis fici W106-1]|uniref:F-box domain-containing protein n=1 Tax=Pestalotiopsis fici (strain W106-1 / CGMCC3.15140) TaxID=1229662 RepID=W3X2M1_PESFW|nr:uncharacterized protein PFICI_09259 [Pestalotiopsis fici W106-1]ETS79406.1 hypothetical protein PFICI_09259 [Pestalotiopsis fici W106-1]